MECHQRIPATDAEIWETLSNLEDDLSGYVLVQGRLISPERKAQEFRRSTLRLVRRARATRAKIRRVLAKISAYQTASITTTSATETAPNATDPVASGPAGDVMQRDVQ